MAPPARLNQTGARPALGALKPTPVDDFQRRRQRSTRISWIIALALLPAALFAMPTAILFTIGMIPTMVALVIDRDPEKYAAVTVGSLNFCGVMPAAISLWQSGHTIDRATTLLLGPFNLLWILLGAAAGWLVYFAVPPLVSMTIGIKAKAEIERLGKRQQELIQEWGEAVMTLDDGLAGVPHPPARPVPSAHQN